jgi:hypothetical protein
MTDRDAQSLAAFLEELSALTIKHGIRIGGCGCCGSPWVSKIEGVKTVPAGAHYVLDEDGERLLFKMHERTSTVAECTCGGYPFCTCRN